MAVTDEIESLHSSFYVNQLRGHALRTDPFSYDRDTYLMEETLPTAELAVGGCLELADKIMAEEINYGFALIRPPGHHAAFDMFGGYCFLNNAAIAAQWFRDNGIDRVSILDVDFHHGNGTQEIFYRDNSVAYGSIHEYPLFPGTGSEKESGVGNIFNAPIQSGTSSQEFLNIFEGKILENIDKFKPEVILLSAGFDAHKRDPLANINLESEDYYTLTKSIVEVANLHCDGRVISFLEGGYDLLALSEGTKEHLKGLNEN